MTFPASFFVHTASVQTLTGTSATGQVFAAAVLVACFVEDVRKLVTTASSEQLASSARVYAPRSAAPIFKPGSLVSSSTFVDGRVCAVAAVNSYDSGVLGLPDHIEVVLL